MLFGRRKRQGPNNSKQKPKDRAVNAGGRPVKPLPLKPEEAARLKGPETKYQISPAEKERAAKYLKEIEQNGLNLSTVRRMWDELSSGGINEVRHNLTHAEREKYSMLVKEMWNK